MSQFIGKNVEVLWERNMDELGRPLGTTRNYLNVAASRAGASTAQSQLNEWIIKGFVSEERLLAVPVVSEA